MIKRASFQKLSYSVTGVYKVYKLSSEEEFSFKKRFQETESLGTTYLTYDNVNRHVFVELFVHEHWILKKFDIRNNILATLGREITEEETKKISEALQQDPLIIRVDYNITTNIWKLVEQDKINLLEKIKEILSEKETS